MQTQSDTSEVMQNMKFRTLKYILVIAEEKSFTKAAQKLVISQPSLSYHVLRLEQELGVLLFDRSKLPLSLTPAGEKYIELAKKILLAKDSFKEAIQNIKGKEQIKLTVAINSFNVLMKLPQIISYLEKNYPYVIFEIYCTSSYEAEHSVLCGKSNFAIFGRFNKSKIDKSHLTYSHLMGEKIMLALPPRYATIYSQNNLPDKSFFEKEHCILYTKDSRIREISDYFFESNHIRPRIILQTISSADIVRYCGQGLGYGFVSESVSKYFNIPPNPIYFYLNDASLVSSIVICRNKSAKLSNIEKEFIRLLLDSSFLQ